MAEDVLDRVIDESKDKVEISEESSKKEEAKKEEASKKGEDEDEDDDEDEDKIDIKQAKNLYRALSDPKTAAPIIEALARQAGLLPDSTRSEKKEIKKTVQDVFKEALGDELGFLADKLGPAIEKVIAHYDTENRGRFEAIAREKTQTEVSAAVEKLYSDFEDAVKFEDRIIELMDEMAPAAGVKTYEYMKKLYRIAKSEASEKDAKTKMKKKLSDNESDATARLSRGTDREEKEAKPKGNLSLDDSIAAAIESMGKTD